MRSPRCAPLLLLLLLLTPPTGDAAVITGVSAPGAPVRPGGAPALRTGDTGGRGDGEASSPGRVARGGDTCFGFPRARLEKCPAPKSSRRRGTLRALEGKVTQVSPHLAPYPAFSPRVWSVSLLS